MNICIYFFKKYDEKRINILLNNQFTSYKSAISTIFI